MFIGVDYKFRDDLKEDTVPIELLTGPYKGVVYRYTKVAVKEKEDNTAVMQFDYHLHYTGELSETTIRRDAKFTHHIGLILNALILETVDNENREDHSEELVEERTLHKESITLSKG
jgi:hypothetical protein